MIYEHEITFYDDSIQYLTSTTNYLNEEDEEFLRDLDRDWETL